MTAVAALTQATGRYCEVSLHPAFAHVWVSSPFSPDRIALLHRVFTNSTQVMVIVAVAVTIAMYCLIQFYIQMKDDLSEHSPFLKVLCIKLVIFFSFWQNVSLSS
jgi:hypothetical protein